MRSRAAPPAPRYRAGEDPDFAKQMDRSKWPALKDKVAATFKTRTRDEWCSIMEGTDVCFAPVLRMSEAATHPHNVARGTFLELENGLWEGRYWLPYQQRRDVTFESRILGGSLTARVVSRWLSYDFNTGWEPTGRREQLTWNLDDSEAFADWRSPVNIVTKGPMVVRDKDVLIDLSARAGDLLADLCHHTL